MNAIFKRLIVAGLLTLPTACATYSRQYYDSGYGYSDSGYYYPNQYGRGGGVVEQNYYNTYSYPTPGYRTEDYHHPHHDHDRYPDRRYQDNRAYPIVSGTTHPNRDAQEQRTNAYYNWNARTSKPFGIPQGDAEGRRHDNRSEGRPRQPNDPNAYGQWQRPQNGGQHENRHPAHGFAQGSAELAGSGWQNTAPTQPHAHHGHPEQEGRHPRNHIEAQSGQ